MISLFHCFHFLTEIHLQGENKVAHCTCHFESDRDVFSRVHSIVSKTDAKRVSVRVTHTESQTTGHQLSTAHVRHVRLPRACEVDSLDGRDASAGAACHVQFVVDLVVVEKSIDERRTWRFWSFRNEIF